MGMPTISLNFIDRDQAFNNIIASIALQEAALSHILNADGEKLQAAVHLVGSTNTGMTLTNLLEANDSVNDLVKSVSDIENLLREKLGSVLDYIQTETELLPDTTPLNIYKVDADELTGAIGDITALTDIPAKAFLQGAAFSAAGRIEMQDVSGNSNGFINVVRQGETDVNGKLVINLPYKSGGVGAGDLPYEISEIIPPEGYQLDKAPVHVSVDPNGDLTGDDTDASYMAKWLDPNILVVANTATP